MTATAPAPPLILIAARPEHSLASVFEGRHYAVVQVHTGTLALDWVREVRPDTIILDADLPDMSGIDACRLLQGDLRIGHAVPTLILAPNQPTPDQRVAALRAGVWDFLPYPPDPEELLLSLETYLQAKRNIDVALAAGLVDPATGLHTRPALARRARELGALMSRERGALACVVFAVHADAAHPKAGSFVARSARVSDVVGALSPTEFVVLAPATDHAGAVKLAQRIGGVLRDVVGASSPIAPAAALQVGYDAATNLKYSPLDPVALLLRATTAVRNGTPEPGYPWMRRFHEAKASYKGASI
jgi:PleD family two-component response regulator